MRERAGLFDLSHMGEVWVSGPEAGAALAYALVSDPPRLANGRAHYSMIAAADGGMIDDLIVYRLADERFLVVPNAANREAVVAALRSAWPTSTPSSTTRRCAHRSSPSRDPGSPRSWPRSRQSTWSR